MSLISAARMRRLRSELESEAGKKMSIRIPVKDRVYLVEVSREEPNK
jgi:hypothetical protein